MANITSEDLECLGLLGAILDEKVVRTAYRRSVLEWHPDLNPGRLEEAEEMIRRINAAYEKIVGHLAEDPSGSPRVDAREFYRRMGYDDLANRVTDATVAIDIERAARALGLSGGVSDILNEKIREKLLFWARGLDYDSGVKILDEDGHFTSRAIDNLLEVAQYYRTMSYQSSARWASFKRAGIFEGDHEKSDANLDDQVMAMVNEFIHSIYVRTPDGWMHRTKADRAVRSLLGKIADLLSWMPGADRMMSLVELKRFDEADGILAERFESLGGDEGRKRAGAAAELEREVERLEAERERLKAKISSLERPNKILEGRLLALNDKISHARETIATAGAKDKLDSLASARRYLKELRILTEKVPGSGAV